MNSRLQKILSAALMTAASSIAVAAPSPKLPTNCAYYAYIDFGPAIVNGNLDRHENVYRNSGLRRFVRFPGSDPRNFRAYYTSHRDTKLSGFEVLNIGPYDTEQVAFAAMQAEIARLERGGYRSKTQQDSMIAVLFDTRVEPC